MSIETRIDQLLDNFSKIAVGLFEITGKYQTTYEQGMVPNYPGGCRELTDSSR